jgi:alpha-beta hydrolase superfamily lysophospholipase
VKAGHVCVVRSDLLFPLLVNSPGKRYAALAGGTHSIIMEKNRLKLFEAVQAFLDEAGRS